MSQVTAGETITITLETGSVRAKVEDASKSDTIMAKIVSSDSADYVQDNIYEFDRGML